MLKRIREAPAKKKRDRQWWQNREEHFKWKHPSIQPTTTPEEVAEKIGVKPKQYSPYRDLMRTGAECTVCDSNVKLFVDWLTKTMDMPHLVPKVSGMPPQGTGGIHSATAFGLSNEDWVSLGATELEASQIMSGIIRGMAGRDGALRLNDWLPTEPYQPDPRSAGWLKRTMYQHAHDGGTSALKRRTKRNRNTKRHTTNRRKQGGGDTSERSAEEVVEAARYRRLTATEKSRMLGAMQRQRDDVKAAQRAALVEWLQSLKAKDLRRKAKDLGVDNDIVDDTIDEDDPKAAVIELIIKGLHDAKSMMVK